MEKKTEDPVLFKSMFKPPSGIGVEYASPKQKVRQSRHALFRVYQRSTA